ncbi:MAG: hypothetical protein ACI9F9_002050 [Candidatus Paceibacteria bacterium]|jgi:hypothetical protein
MLSERRFRVSGGTGHALCASSRNHSTPARPFQGVGARAFCLVFRSYAHATSWAPCVVRLLSPLSNYDVPAPSPGKPSAPRHLRYASDPSSYRALVIFNFSTLACFFTDSSLRVSEVAIVLRLMRLPAISLSCAISEGVQACRCRSNFLAMCSIGIDAQDPDSREGTPREPRGPRVP